MDAKQHTSDKHTSDKHARDKHTSGKRSSCTGFENRVTYKKLCKDVKRKNKFCAYF